MRLGAWGCGAWGLAEDNSGARNGDGYGAGVAIEMGKNKWGVGMWLG